MNKIMAFLALFGIIIWIIWTTILFIFSWWNWNNNKELTPEQYKELQELINSQSWNVINSWSIINNTSSWIKIETNSWTTSLSWTTQQ